MSEYRDFFKRLIINMDWVLLFAVAVLIAIGFLGIHSAALDYVNPEKYFNVQLLAVGIGASAMFLFAAFNYQYYKQFDLIVYLLSVLLLCSVLAFGVTINGARRWISLGVASFQPVEIAKLMYVLVLASFLDKKSKTAKKFSFIVTAFILLAGHCILVILQPDFSSTLSYFPVTLVLLYAAGAEAFHILCIIVFAAFAAGIPLLSAFIRLHSDFLQSGTFITNFLLSVNKSVVIICLLAALIFLIMFLWWFMRKLFVRVHIIYPIFICIAVILGCAASFSVDKSIKGYQRKRIEVFLNPKADLKGSAYNIIQSKITIGSGKFSGKGLKKGTQTHLGFLPEQHTDFIFSVISEEGGWIASQLVLLFYFLFIWRALSIAKDSRDKYGSLVALGIAVIFVFYAFVNIGMTMGLMPVTGMPLLFVSYGGTSIVSSLCAVGILLSINIRRHTHY